MVTSLCAFAVFVGSLILAYAINRPILNDIPVTGDEPWYLIQAYTLIHYHSVNVAPVIHNAKIYHQFLGGPDDHTQDYVGNGERILPNLPGYAALIAPFYLWKGRVGIVMFQALLAALTSALLFVEGTLAFRSRLAGLFASLAYLFALPALLYVSQIFPSVAATFVAFAGYVLAVRLIPVARGRLLILAGIALGVLVFILPWLHTKYAPAAIVLVALAVWSLRARLRWPMRSASRAERQAWATVAIAAGPLTVSFLLIGLYSHKYFGSWFPRISPLPNSGMSLRYFNLGRGLTLYQDIYLSRSSGLFPWVPLYLLAIPGFVLLWRHSRRDGLSVALMLVALLGVFVSAVLSTQVYQGLAFPSRFSVEGAPFFALCVTAVFAANVGALRAPVRGVWARWRSRTRPQPPDLQRPRAGRAPSASTGRRAMLYGGAALATLACVFLLALSGYFTDLGAHDPLMIYGSPAGSTMPMKYPDRLPAWWFYAFPETPGTVVYTRTIPLNQPETMITKTGGETEHLLHTPRTNLAPGIYRVTYTFSCTSTPGDSGVRIYVVRLSEIPGTIHFSPRTIAEREEPVSICSGARDSVSLTFNSNGYDPTEFYAGIVASGTGASGTLRGTATFTPLTIFPLSYAKSAPGGPHA